MGRQPTTDGCPTCQICGGLIHTTPHYWDDNPLLPMHRDIRHCQGNGTLLFSAFLGRNIDYIMGRGEPVLREAV